MSSQWFFVHLFTENFPHQESGKGPCRKFSSFQKHSTYTTPLLCWLKVITHFVPLLRWVIVKLEVILMQNTLLSKVISRGKLIGSMCWSRSKHLNFLLTGRNWALLKATWQIKPNSFLTSSPLKSLYFVFFICCSLHKISNYEQYQMQLILLFKRIWDRWPT